MINEYTRLGAACRRFKFECLNAIGIFWIIEKSHWFKIKEPYRKLYKRKINR